MGFGDNLFGSSDQSYPTRPTGPVPDPCGSGPYEVPDSHGFFNKLLAPKQLAYPTPACRRPILTPLLSPSTPAVVPVLVATPAQAAPSSQSTAPASAQQTAAAATQPTAPVLVLLQGGASATPIAVQPTTVAAKPTTATAVSATSGNGAATATPVVQSGADSIAPGEPNPTAPVSKVLRAFVFNPEMTSCLRTAQQDFIEQELGEELGDDIAAALSSKMISRDGTPVAFVVPDGCDSVDLLCGPIEVNPGCGCDGDLDQVITVGTAKLSANVDGIDRPLIPGEQIIVTVPWRSASWVDLPASRLRVQLLANFYNSQASA
jgi:hypothetical protein